MVPSICGIDGKVIFTVLSLLHCHNVNLIVLNWTWKIGLVMLFCSKSWGFFLIFICVALKTDDNNVSNFHLWLEVKHVEARIKRLGGIVCLAVPIRQGSTNWIACSNSKLEVFYELGNHGFSVQVLEHHTSKYT